jgi:hypothetical protein
MWIKYGTYTTCKFNFRLGQMHTTILIGIGSSRCADRQIDYCSTIKNLQETQFRSGPEPRDMEHANADFRDRQDDTKRDQSELPRARQKSTVPNKRKWHVICFGFWETLWSKVMNLRPVKLCAVIKGTRWLRNNASLIGYFILYTGAHPKPHLYYICYITTPQAYL